MIAFPIAAFIGSVLMLAVLGFRDKAKYLKERNERLSRMRSDQSSETSPGAKATA
jgi:hypothetical protein